MELPPPPPALAERLHALGLMQEGIARAYLNVMRPAVEAATLAFTEFERCLRENPPAPPPRDFVFIRDEDHVWTAVDGLVGVDFGYEPAEAVVVWPRQSESGKRVVALALEAAFQQTEAVKGLFAWVDAHVRARQDSTVSRLADELGRPPSLVRRQFDAVQDVLEAAGIGDGYGRLTVPQPVRLPVQAPAP